MTKIISHRGNLIGVKPECENNPTYIDQAIAEGFDVEIDVWFIDGEFFLGHDSARVRCRYVRLRYTHICPVELFVCPSRAVVVIVVCFDRVFTSMSSLRRQGCQRVHAAAKERAS